MAVKPFEVLNPAAVELEGAAACAVRVKPNNAALFGTAMTLELPGAAGAPTIVSRFAFVKTLQP